MKKTILILVANPQNTSSLGLLPEINKLEEAIQRSLNKDHFQVVWKVAVQEKDYRRHILDIKPNIIHYCGHATETGLLLHDDKQKPQLLSNEFIVDLLKEFNDRLECVVLNACETETLAELLANHLNYAIGMKLEVKDKAAIAFSEGFYDALGGGESIETAFNIGKNTVLGLDTSGNPIGRKAIYDDYNLTENEPIPNHLIPVIKINPYPTEIKPIWLSEEEKRKAIEDLLRKIESFDNKIKLFHSSEAITLKDQYILIQVTLERHYKDKLETIGSYAEVEAELRKIYALKGSSEEEIKKTQEDWNKAKEKQDYIIVLADPGMGKSTLLRMEVCQTIEQSLQELNEGKSLETVKLPLFMRLSSLADEEDLTIYQAILKLVKHRYSRLLQHQENDTVSRFLNEFIERQLQSGNGLLLLDALDEVPLEKRTKLIEKLNTFVKNYPCPIIATSIIVGYGGKLIDKGKEMEIVPFTQKQTEEYISTWFNNAKDHLKDSSITAPDLIKALKERPQISGLAQNPLLLSLICSLYQHDQLQLPARKGQIYEKAVNSMLKDWVKNRPVYHPERVIAKIRLLEAMAYYFSCQGAEVFDHETLYDWLEDYLEEEAPRDLREDKTGELIAELSEEDGILQTLYRNADNPQYLFLHRTFQEYLTASYINCKIRKHPKEGIGLIKPYFWDYDWHETITLLAGLLKKPMVLIEAIREERDDIFKTQLLLAGRCLGECDEIESSMVEEIIEGVFELWQWYRDIEFFETVLIEIGRSYDKVVEGLLSALKDEDGYVRGSAAGALAEIGSEKVVEGLLSVLNDEYGLVRGNAADALVNIGGEKVVEGLLSALKDEDSRMRECAAYALGNIGSEKLVEELFSALKDEDSYVRKKAAGALVNIGGEKVVEGLLFALKDEDFEVRESAARALGKIGNDKAVEGLLSALKDEDFEVRESAVEGLLSALEDEDFEVRESAAGVLGNIGNDKLLEGLLSALKDEDFEVRGNAAYALGKIGSDKAVEGLLSALKDEDSYVRWIAAEALGKIGSLTVLETLIQSHNINIYDNDIFPIVRRLAIKYSKSGSPFIPVYPELISQSQD